MCGSPSTEPTTFEVRAWLHPEEPGVGTLGKVSCSFVLRLRCKPSAVPATMSASAAKISCRSGPLLLWKPTEKARREHTTEPEAGSGAELQRPGRSMETEPPPAECARRRTREEDVSGRWANGSFLPRLTMTLRKEMCQEFCGLPRRKRQVLGLKKAIYSCLNERTFAHGSYCDLGSCDVKCIKAPSRTSKWNRKGNV